MEQERQQYSPKQWLEWYNEPETQEFVKLLTDAADATNMNFVEASCNAIIENDEKRRHKAIIAGTYDRAYRDILQFIENLTKAG